MRGKDFYNKEYNSYICKNGAGLAYRIPWSPPDSRGNKNAASRLCFCKNWLFWASFVLDD